MMANPPHQIVTESGAVDHLDKEAVRDRVERLRDAHGLWILFGQRLTLVEARNHFSRNGEQGRGGGVP